MFCRWAVVDDASDDEEEDADAVAAAASKESAAERMARVNGEIKSNLTAILLDVTDAIFGACSSRFQGFRVLTGGFCPTAESAHPKE